MSQGLKRTGAHVSLLLHNDKTTFKGKQLAKCNLCLLYNTNKTGKRKKKLKQGKVKMEKIG